MIYKEIDQFSKFWQKRNISSRNLKNENWSPCHIYRRKPYVCDHFPRLLTETEHFEQKSQKRGLIDMSFLPKETLCFWPLSKISGRIYDIWSKIDGVHSRQEKSIWALLEKLGMIYDYIIMDNVTSSLQLLCTALAQQSFNQTITNNTNRETTPAGIKHFQDTWACDVYVGVYMARVRFLRCMCMWCVCGAHVLSKMYVRVGCTFDLHYIYAPSSRP